MRKFGVFIGIMAIFVALLILLPIIDSWGVKFEDPRLEAAIKSALDKPNAPYIKVTRTDLAKIHYLNISNMSINSLEGIERLTKLVSLDASNNQLKSVEPLKRLSNLRELNISNNGIANLEAIGFFSLSQLPLRKLDISYNGIWSIDHRVGSLSEISMLVQFKELESLNISGNSILDISSLGNLKKLKELDASRNPLEDISPIQRLVNLQHLNLRETSVSDLTAIIELSDLRYLNLHSCKDIGTLAPIGNLKKLHTIIVANIPLGDATHILSKFNALERLNLRNTKQDSYDFLVPILQTGTLLELDISQNRILYQSVGKDEFSVIRSYWELIPSKYPVDLPYPEIEPPSISHPAGLVEPNQIITISSQSGDRILYTIDGSIPDPDNIILLGKELENGKFSATSRTYEYTGPIDLDRSFSRVNEISIIPTSAPKMFPDDRTFITPTENIPKGVVLRAISISDSGARSRVVTNSYFLDTVSYIPEDSLIFSLSTNPENLFDNFKGIFVPGSLYIQGDDGSGNYYQRGKEWERSAHLELFGDNGLEISQEIGFRIHGGTSRYYPQKSLRLYSDFLEHNQTFRFPFFPEKEMDQYHSLLLRNGGNDWGYSLIRDVAAHQLIRNWELETQDAIQASAYINGEYWGLFFVRELFDEYYLARKYALALDDFTILERNAELVFGEELLSYQFRDMVEKISAGDLSSLEEIDQYMTVLDFLDYMIMEIYAVNTDWPRNNVKYWRYSGPEEKMEAGTVRDGRWRWFVYDMDRAFGFAEGKDFDMVSFALEGTGRSWALNRDLFNGLLSHYEIGSQFLQRSAMHLNSTFNP